MHTSVQTAPVAVIPSQLPVAPAMLRTMLFNGTGTFRSKVEYVPFSSNEANELKLAAERRLKADNWRLVAQSYCLLPFGFFPKDKVMWLWVALTVASGQSGYEVYTREVPVFASSGEPLVDRLRDVVKDLADQAGTKAGWPAMSLSVALMP